MTSTSAPGSTDISAGTSMQPGVTGWAQVNGLRSDTETLGRMQRRVDHDLAYVEGWSLLLDLRITLRTLLCLVDRNAY